MPKGVAIEDAVKDHANGQDDTEKEDSGKEWQLRSKRLAVTSEIHNMLYHAAADSKSAMTQRDSEEFIELGITEKAFQISGAITEEKKLEAVMDMKKYAAIFTEEAKTLGSAFLSTIENAQSKHWISKASADRWRARLKEHSGKWPETRAFLKNFTSEYVSNWQALHEDLEKIEKIQKAFGIDEKTVKELSPLQKAGFEEKDYHDKRNLVSTALAALKEYMVNDEKLSEIRLAAENALRKAVKDGAISEYKVGPWLDHVVSGKRSLPELLKFIKDWEKIRAEYDTLEQKMDAMPRDPQGFVRISEAKFLLLSYEQRVSYVQEANWRVKHHLNQPLDTPIEDLKGKIRHALDIKEWGEAEYYLEKAKKIAMGNDINELHSMEWNLENFRTDKEEKESTDKSLDGQAVFKAHEEITAAIQLLPGPLRNLYSKALTRGAETFRCLRKTTGNVVWCADRGYLSEEIIDESRDKAESETRERMKVSGAGHGHGLENNLVTGFGKGAIRDRGNGPQNVHLTAGDEDAFVKEAEENKDVYSFWYWTNLLVKGVSIEQYRFVCEALHPILSKNAAILQKHGFVYTSSRPLVSLN